MIIEWLLDFIEGGFNILAALFPVSSWNPVGILADAFSVMGGLNYFIPISELVSLTAAFLVLGVPFASASLVAWLVALIRGGSSRG